MNRTGSDQNYNSKTDFETRRENQDFGRQNNSMTSGTTSPIDLIPVGTKRPEPMTLTLPTDFTEQHGKTHIPGEPDPDLSSSESSLNISNLLKDSKISKSIKTKSNNKKKRQKHST